MKLRAVWERLTAEPKRRRQMTIIVLFVVALLVIITPSFYSDFKPLPDMKSYRTAPERKAVFFDYLRPIVEHHNGKIIADRSKLLAIADEFDTAGEISWWDELWLQRLAAEYEVEWDTESMGHSLAILKRRVDLIPTSLALIQAAKESGWGRSRFAVDGNGLFGQWCYNPGCGLVPKNRKPGAQHEVQRFDSVSDSVASYLKNINTDERYRPLRMIRQELRETGKAPDGLSLADGLLFYSERREDYVKEVKKMLRGYKARQQAAVETHDKAL